MQDEQTPSRLASIHPRRLVSETTDEEEPRERLGSRSSRHFEEELDYADEGGEEREDLLNTLIREVQKRSFEPVRKKDRSETRERGLGPLSEARTADNRDSRREAPGTAKLLRMARRMKDLEAIQQREAEEARRLVERSSRSFD